MKSIKLLFLLVCLSSQLYVSGQIFNPPYDFFKQTATYQHLGSTATILSPSASNWDDTTFTITTPFPFTFMNQTSTQFVVNSYGTFALRSDYDSTRQFWGKACANFLLDYIATPKSIVKTQTTGANGSRILKIEFENVGLYIDTLGNDSLNFQLWLYESDNAFEWHVGDSYIADAYDYGNFTGVNVLNFKTNDLDLSISNNTLDSASYLTGNANSPTYVALTKDYFFIDTVNFAYSSLTGWPSNNTVFRFVPKTISSIGGIQNAKYKTNVYPNPSADHIQFDVDHVITNPKILIINRLGQIVAEETYNSASHFDISISQLPSSSFQIMVYSEGVLMISESFIKK